MIFVFTGHLAFSSSKASSSSSLSARKSSHSKTYQSNINELLPHKISLERDRETCLWSQHLLLLTTISEASPPMADAMFSTMCSVISSRFPGSMSLRFDLWEEALTVLFGKKILQFTLGFLLRLLM